ncbi:hypothetical protein CEXT_77911 [Caerostris extrusa]|uniref:Uncharacterized protein n=1 Tax=Caerostris extrusa TaxID=172846 RepID=A0AAV4S761_CAEEX|nr:hypothetical protein CEXT_77911 [Caerostris extrusa]
MLWDTARLPTRKKCGLNVVKMRRCTAMTEKGAGPLEGWLVKRRDDDQRTERKKNKTEIWTATQFHSPDKHNNLLTEHRYSNDTTLWDTVTPDRKNAVEWCQNKALSSDDREGGCPLEGGVGSQQTDDDQRTGEKE